MYDVVIVPAQSQMCSEKTPLAEHRLPMNIVYYTEVAVRSIDFDALILGSGHEKELVSKLEKIGLLLVPVKVQVGLALLLADSIVEEVRGR
jgi:hypothetical protein